VRHFGWDTVVTISSGGIYGLAGIAEFEAAALVVGLAVAHRWTFAGSGQPRAVLGVS
jgi:hypothetical protein